MNFLTNIKNYLFPKKIKVEDFFIKTTKRKDILNEEIECRICKNKKNNFCFRNKTESCHWVQILNNFDQSKESILIIDDNLGMISFIRDDLEAIFLDMGRDISDFNILEFSTKNAAYKFLATLNFYKDLNITKAIIDITYSGNVQTEEGNIRLNGVDVFKEVFEANENLDFIFYTGNLLNSYIKSNKEIIKKFTSIHGGSILNFVLFKAAQDIDERREYIKNMLFSRRYKIVEEL